MLVVIAVIALVIFGWSSLTLPGEGFGTINRGFIIGLSYYPDELDKNDKEKKGWKGRP